MGRGRHESCYREPLRWLVCLPDAAHGIDRNAVLDDYPRPKLRRNDGINLNEPWHYAITPKQAAQPTVQDGEIVVPFFVESPHSGVEQSVSATQSVPDLAAFQAAGHSRHYRVGAQSMSQNTKENCADNGFDDDIFTW